MSKNELNSDRDIYLQFANMHVPSWGYGGPVRLFFDYARWLAAHFQVEVFSGDVHHDWSRLPATETVAGVSIHREHVLLPHLARKSVYLITPQMCLQAAKLIRASDRPVVIHFSELRGLVPLYALLLKAVFPDRVLLVHSAFGSLHYKPSMRRRIHDALFMRAFVKLVDLSLAQNEHERQSYRALCRQFGNEDQVRIDVLPLHIERAPSYPERFTTGGKDRSAVTALRNKYGVAEDAMVFMFLGRLHAAKGLIRLVDAFNDFSKSTNKNSVLLIVGRDDGFQDALTEYIGKSEFKDRIRIINNVYDDRFDYYFLADIFLGFPTIFEETMLSSVEAMSCGTPIIVSREADVPYVQDEGAGLVIDFQVGRAVDAMSKVERELNAFQLKARVVAETHFSGETAARNLKGILSSLVGDLPRT